MFGNAEENNFPFSLEISLTGYFRGSENIEREKFIELTKYNGTAILFPYLRSAVSDITKAANINPLILPVINVINFIKEQEKKDKENSGFQGE
ncbi:protein-export chaperone SecB [Caldicellulosiruptor danielii]|uniref:protein-export chaperone SecB n=1 Tax=Anaerocellum danielii TaxID=1387557 RepID=UPI003A5C553E